MLINIGYDRRAAVEYALKWALLRNPEYYSFLDLGGDCTNFASQCVYAGSRVMNYTSDYGWYYINQNDRSPSWTGVEFFYAFMTENRSVGPYADEVDLNFAEPGDVLQLGRDDGMFYHSLVVLSQFGNETYIAAHSNDALFRPLSSYEYDKIRCIHFLGVLDWK